MSFYSDAPAELIYAMPASGGAVTGTVTIGSAAGGPDLGSTSLAAELPHNYFSKIGKSILIEGGGFFTTGATNTVTLKFGLGINTSVGIVTANILCSTGAFSMLATAVTDGVFDFRALVTCTALGTAGTLNAAGRLLFGSKTVTTTVGVPTYLMSPSATSTPFTFVTNQTTPVYIEPFAYWGTTSLSPSMTLTNYYMWGLN